MEEVGACEGKERGVRGLVPLIRDAVTPESVEDPFLTFGTRKLRIGHFQLSEKEHHDSRGMGDSPLSV